MPLNFDQLDCRTVLESLPIGVYVVDTDRRIVFWNDGAERITGYLRHEVIGRHCGPNLLEHCDETNAVLCGQHCPLVGTMHDGQRRDCSVFLRHKEGQRVPVRVQAVPLRDDFGHFLGAVECFDTRELLPQGVDVQQFGMHHIVHSPTELPNPQKTLACLVAEIADFKESQIPFGVLVVRVDDLDRVLRTSGRSAVDSVSGVVVRTLAANLGPNDLVGLWSENYYVVMIKNCTVKALVRCAELLKGLIHAAAIPWWGDRLSVTVSIGGTLVHEGDTPESMIARADGNLKNLAEAGGDHVVVAG